MPSDYRSMLRDIYYNHGVRNPCQEQGRKKLQTKRLAKSVAAVAVPQDLKHDTIEGLVAIIGRKSSKTSPIPPARPSSPVDRPVTRSKAPNPATNLVSKPDVMSEYASAESVQALQDAVTAMQTE
nr:hypothetical protein Iba_chr12cCG14760 [Ipomoea batatas]